VAFSILADRELRYAAPRTAAKSSEPSPGTGSWPVMAFARRHLFVLWGVWALGCVVAMFLRPAEPTIPYQLGWAGCALVFGLGTWGRWRLVSALSWYTLVSGAALERSWKLGVIGWNETSAIPLMLLLALMIGWHAYRRQIALAVVTRLAATDSLTGLANRATFNSTLSDALEDQSCPNTTVLFVDLDDFKGINDVFGHGAGDDLLREVGARLVRVTRPGDLCTRLGGDEFAVMLRGTGSEEAEHVALRIVEAIADTILIGGRVTHVGASVGVATATREGDLESLIHCADVAMSVAKTKGKSRIQVFEPALLDHDTSLVAFERALIAAAGNHELVVHYQPVLSIPEGRCTAVEALVRWQHPERGLLHPDSFIPIAERIGAIGPIGTYVLRQACADASTWSDAHPGSPIAVHVNISALQLDDDAFIDIVSSCLREFALAPQQLVLEVTETVVISSPLAIDRLNTLAALGVTIAIDDFGTGYSALTTLRSLPASIVKIDKSFVTGSTNSTQDRAVIEAVVMMATQMGMQTIAEGVENAEERLFLEKIGADAAQGYLYLGPTPAEKFGAWLGRHLASLQNASPLGDCVPAAAPRHTA
jgi:diguanylate cyclase (GGDEF)-like protein